MSIRNLFFNHVAQTSTAPLGIEMSHANGIYIYDVHGKKYIDGIAGFSVANIGHGNKKVIAAINEQIEKYMHVIVYGEYIQQPQVAYANLLIEHLPKTLNCVYFTNSGTEATEGALKLAKRITGKQKILACHKAYHGSTHGALSVMGDEYYKNAYRPLLPNIEHFSFGSDEFIKAIDKNTASVIIETVQAESGVTTGNIDWFIALQKKCSENCVLLIADEIQAGFGRTGTLWAFEQFGFVPDILLLGKALGGGLPLGAFIAEKKLMSVLTHNPILGHITTFGGHPVSCAAGKAAFEVLLEKKYIDEVSSKVQILFQKINHTAIVKKQGIGLWMSVYFANEEVTKKIMRMCISNGLITDLFLFNDTALRIAPPLSISEIEIEELCTIFNTSIDMALAL
jgi:acetylornithine/N-succinyldiaminopimelate aminotransferase